MDKGGGAIRWFHSNLAYLFLHSEAIAQVMGSRPVLSHRSYNKSLAALSVGLKFFVLRIEE